MQAIYAGIVIGLAAAANLAVGGGIIGAAIFSFALLMICALKFHLFTGKVGAAFLGQYKLSKLAQAYFFNAIGILLVVLLTWENANAEAMHALAVKIAQERIGWPWWASIFMGVLCGMCVQLAVDGWNETKQPLVVMMPVVVFMIAGAHHCIADMFYLSYAGWIKGSLWSLLFTTLGNVLGSFVFVQRRMLQAHIARKNPKSASNSSHQCSNDSQLDMSELPIQGSLPAVEEPYFLDEPSA